jgi:tRNA(His) 5'-end guanylyltransferase
MVAQSLFSHKELHGKNTKDKHDMMHEKGVNWATDYTDGQKNGRLIVKESFPTLGDYPDKPEGLSTHTVMRTKWVSKGAWKFTENKEKLLAMIPKYEN